MTDIIIASKQKMFCSNFMRWAKYHLEIAEVGFIYVNFDDRPSAEEIQWLRDKAIHFEVDLIENPEETDKPLTNKIINHLANVYNRSKADSFIISLDLDEFLYFTNPANLKRVLHISKRLGGVSVKTLETCGDTNEGVLVLRRNYISRAILMLVCPNLLRITNFGYFGHTVGKCIYYKRDQSKFDVRPSAHHVNQSWLSRVVGEVCSVNIIHFDHHEKDEFYDKLISRTDKFKHANLGRNRERQLTYFLDGNFEEKYSRLYSNIFRYPILPLLITKTIRNFTR